MKVCHHEDQYTIEVLVKSLFQGRTASWVRIVNGVDKHVTESTLTKEEEDIASVKPIAEAIPRQKPSVALTPVSIFVRERRWTDIESQRWHDYKCFDVSKPSLDCQDMTKLFLQEATEQSTTMTSLKSAGRRSSMVLRNGHLKIWMSILAKGGGPKKRFHTSCTFQQFKDIQEVMAIAPTLQDNVLLQKGLPSTSSTSGTRMNWSQ